MKGRIKYRKTGALRIFAEGTEVYMACARPLTIDAGFFLRKLSSPPVKAGGLLLLGKYLRREIL